jgi:micrococcal nuclease
VSRWYRYKGEKGTMKKEKYLYNGFCTKVVDGDTIDVNVDLGFTVFVKIRLRLRGINTMEMSDKDPTIRARAVAAKQFLEDRVLNENVVIESFKADKYGRWLADVFVSDTSINNLLLEEGHAVVASCFNIHFTEFRYV